MAEKIATREAYGNALAEFGEKYDFVVLDADLAAATKTGVFKKKFPDRFFDCGIAEGNLISVSAGLAAAGKIPFASTFAMFAAGRAFEQGTMFLPQLLLPRQTNPPPRRSNMKSPRTFWTPPPIWLG